MKKKEKVIKFDEHEGRQQKHLFRKAKGEFPSGPVIQTLCFPCRGHGFDSWLRLRKVKSHKPHGAAKKNKNKNPERGSICIEEHKLKFLPKKIKF